LFCIVHSSVPCDLRLYPTFDFCDFGAIEAIRFGVKKRDGEVANANGAMRLSKWLTATAFPAKRKKTIWID
jgi:hypothetical protein